MTEVLIRCPACSKKCKMKSVAEWWVASWLLMLGIGYSWNNLRWRLGLYWNLCRGFSDRDGCELSDNFRLNHKSKAWFCSFRGSITEHECFHSTQYVALLRPTFLSYVNQLLCPIWYPTISLNKLTLGKKVCRAWDVKHLVAQMSTTNYHLISADHSSCLV